MVHAAVCSNSSDQSSTPCTDDPGAMSNFIKLTAQVNLPGPNEAKEFSCANKEICVANVNGTYSAMDNICLHRGGPLGQGTIENGKIVCPWHSWAWDPVTGEAAHNASAKIAVYPLRFENGEVLIEVQSGTDHP